MEIWYKPNKKRSFRKRKLGDLTSPTFKGLRDIVSDLYGRLKYEKDRRERLIVFNESELNYLFLVSRALVGRLYDDPQVALARDREGSVRRLLYRLFEGLTYVKMMQICKAVYPHGPNDECVSPERQILHDPVVVISWVT